MKPNWIPLSDKSRPPVPHEECLWFGTRPGCHFWILGYKDAAWDIVIETSTDERFPISDFLAYQPLYAPHNFWCCEEYSKKPEKSDWEKFFEWREEKAKKEMPSNVIEFKRPVKVGREL